MRCLWHHVCFLQLWRSNDTSVWVLFVTSLVLVWICILRRAVERHWCVEQNSHDWPWKALTMVVSSGTVHDRMLENGCMLHTQPASSDTCMVAHCWCCNISLVSGLRSSFVWSQWACLSYAGTVQNLLCYLSWCRAQWHCRTQCLTNIDLMSMERTQEGVCSCWW